ncbi:unnamed protein product [Vitrella brassicaformis CCMP3155]|uniref:J domain-containing protein n=1 Tax=Vitrella brassicaformis (strain CCMP3155) TaxID=1169540 RepID=A0A0G4EFH8_VITBC|nr:unnamed protein product [Vitrella brassicaformis CCMP3155]|eukprot:CEL94182.1 unnamed protein product [Vitrella brassicaformis CCMP3155]
MMQSLSCIDDALRTLGLCSSATSDDIRARYKELSLRCHPDKGGSVEAFQRLQEAYDICRLHSSEGFPPPYEEVQLGGNEHLFTPAELAKIYVRIEEIQRGVAAANKAHDANLAKLRERWAKQRAAEAAVAKKMGPAVAAYIEEKLTADKARHTKHIANTSRGAKKEDTDTPTAASTAPSSSSSSSRRGAAREDEKAPSQPSSTKPTPTTKSPAVKKGEAKKGRTREDKKGVSDRRWHGGRSAVRSADSFHQRPTMPRQADKSGALPPRPSAPPPPPTPQNGALGPLPTVERGDKATHELKEKPIIPSAMGGSKAEARDMDAKAPPHPSPTVPDGLSESRHASSSNQSAANGEPDPTSAFPLTLRLRALIPDRQPLGVCPWRPTRRDPWAKVRVCFNKIQGEYVNIKDFHTSQWPMKEAYREAIKVRNSAARLGLAAIPIDQADHVLDTEDWSNYETLDTAPKRRKRRQNNEPPAPVPHTHSRRMKVSFIEQLRSLLPPEAPLGLSAVPSTTHAAPPTAIETIMVGFRQQEGQPREEVVCADFPSLRAAVECAVDKRNAKAAEWSLHPLPRGQVDAILQQVDWAKWEGVGGGADDHVEDAMDEAGVASHTTESQGRMKRTVNAEPGDAPHHPHQHGEQSDGSECEDEEQPLQMRLHRANLDLMKDLRRRVTDRVRALTPADNDSLYPGIYMSNKKAAFFASVKEEAARCAQQKRGPPRRVAKLGLRGAFAMGASDRDRLADAVGIPACPTRPPLPLKPPINKPIVENRRPDPAASASGVALSAQLALTDGVADGSAEAEMGKDRADLLAIVPFFQHGEGQSLPPPSGVLATLSDDRTVLCDAIGVAHPSTLVDLHAFLTAGGDIGKMDTGIAADGHRHSSPQPHGRPMTVSRS